MAQVTSTHRHDYRWPTADCLVPRAEAPNGGCVKKPAEFDGTDKPWCGRDKPAFPANVTISHPDGVPENEQVCKDLVHTPGDRPWCQRGPLVPQITSRAATVPPQIRMAPVGCESSDSGKPWCEEGGLSREVSARVGAAPQQDISRYDQPNQYLRVLCNKFPQPVSVVTATPRDELMRLVYADRYRTTYQTDYCRNSDDTARQLGECDTHVVSNKQTEQPTHGYSDNITSTVHEKCKCGCQVMQELPQPSGVPGGGDEPRIRPLACRPAAVSKNFHFSCCTPKKQAGQQSTEHVGPPEKIPPWISEYNDSIGKTARLIFDQKLHYPKNTRKFIC